jgi:hypothetical protein
MREGLQGRVTRALAQPGIQEQQALLESLQTIETDFRAAA